MDASQQLAEQALDATSSKDEVAQSEICTYNSYIIVSKN